MRPLHSMDVPSTFPQNIDELVNHAHHWKKEDAKYCLDMLVRAMSDVYHGDFSSGLDSNMQREHRERAVVNLVRAAEVASKYYALDVAMVFVRLQGLLPIVCMGRSRSREQFEPIPPEAGGGPQDNPPVSALIRKLVDAQAEIGRTIEQPVSIRSKIMTALRNLFRCL